MKEEALIATLKNLLHNLSAADVDLNSNNCCPCKYIFIG